MMFFVKNNYQRSVAVLFLCGPVIAQVMFAGSGRSDNPKVKLARNSGLDLSSLDPAKICAWKSQVKTDIEAGRAVPLSWVDLTLDLSDIPCFICLESPCLPLRIKAILEQAKSSPHLGLDNSLRAQADIMTNIECVVRKKARPKSS